MKTNKTWNDAAAQKAFARAATEKRELEGLVRLFQTTDRILSGRDLVVRLADGPSTDTYMDSAGAWTDGIDIWLNQKVVSEKRRNSETIETMVAGLKGLNYHELAHILFSPRMNGTLAKRVINTGRAEGDLEVMWWCFNALEDQKVEMLFGKRYKLAYSYFKHTNLDFIIGADKQDFTSLLSLEHGRLFLPKELRSKLFSLYADANGLAAATEIADVIEQYIVLNTSTTKGKDEAMRLILRMYKVLPHNDDGSSKEQPDAASAHFVNPTVTPYGSDTDDSSIDEGRIKGGQPEKLDDDELSDLQDDFDADPERSEPEEASDDDGESSDGAGDAEEGDSSSVPDITNKSMVPNAAKDVSADVDKLIDGIREDAEHAQAESLSSDTKFQHDVDLTAQALGGGGNGVGDYSQNRMGSFVELPITSDMRSHQPKVMSVLKKMRLDVEPMWHSRQESGSVNAERVMLSERTMELDVFDLWDEGSEEEGGIEVVLLLDLSSSMWMNYCNTDVNKPNYMIIKKNVEAGLMEAPTDCPIVSASQAIWMLKRTLDNLSIPVTVLGYNTRWSVLYMDTERASHTDYRLFDSDGGTNPTGCIQEATAILKRSKFKNKVLVAVTDGQWGGDKIVPVGSRLGEQSIETYIRSLRQQNITTMLLGIGGAVNSYGTHEFEIAKDMTETMDIADIVEKLVKSIMLKAIHSRSELG